MELMEAGLGRARDQVTVDPTIVTHPSRDPGEQFGIGLRVLVSSALAPVLELDIDVDPTLAEGSKPRIQLVGQIQPRLQCQPGRRVSASADAGDVDVGVVATKIEGPGNQEMIPAIVVYAQVAEHREAHPELQAKIGRHGVQDGGADQNHQQQAYSRANAVIHSASEAEDRVLGEARAQDSREPDPAVCASLAGA